MLRVEWDMLKKDSGSLNAWEQDQTASNVLVQFVFLFRRRITGKHW